MVSGLSSGDGYSWMNPLSVLSASLVLVLLKEKKLMILDVPKQMTDSLSLIDCANDFVGSSEKRLSVFGKFC